VDTRAFKEEIKKFHDICFDIRQKLEMKKGEFEKTADFEKRKAVSKFDTSKIYYINALSLNFSKSYDADNEIMTFSYRLEDRPIKPAQSIGLNGKPAQFTMELYNESTYIASNSFGTEVEVEKGIVSSGYIYIKNYENIPRDYKFDSVSLDKYLGEKKWEYLTFKANIPIDIASSIFSYNMIIGLKIKDQIKYNYRYIGHVEPTIDEPHDLHYEEDSLEADLKEIYITDSENQHLYFKTNL
jgi:hypothetical protein